MDRIPDAGSVDRRTDGRWRTRLIALAAVLLLAGSIAHFQSAASALPPRCGDGSPPPCGDPTPTTRPHRPPPPPPPPPIVWTASVSVLDQSASGFDRSVRGSWGQDGSPSYTTPSGDVAWTDAARTEGTIGLSGAYLPPGTVGFRLFELSESGRLCRSQPLGAIPATGRTIHVLAGPTITKTPTDLADLVSSFSGRVSPDPDGAEVTITSATLVPQQTSGLLLTLNGRLWKDMQWPIPNVDASFSYVVMLHLDPSLSVTDPHEVMTARADVGTLKLKGDGVTDRILISLGGDVEPDFRKAVTDKATAAVNDSIAALPEVGWFGSLGYTVSVRRVTTNAWGVQVLPSLCKVN